MLSHRFLINSISAFLCTVAVTPAFAQSIYIRGDLGWSGSTNANIHDRNFPLDHVIQGGNGTAGTLSDIGSGWLIGTGVGLNFLPNIRGDLVYTYRGDYSLDQTDHNNPPTRFKADLHSHSLMANAYYDIPFDESVSGFVGFGIGWAEVNVSHVSATSTTAINPLVIPPAPTAVGSTALAPGGTMDNFAWQIMAGLAFPIDNGISIDMFYRYFDAGHFATSAGNVTINGNVVGTYHGAEGALHSHEVVLSVRIPVSL